MWSKIEMDSGNKFHIINRLVENLGRLFKAVSFRLKKNVRKEESELKSFLDCHEKKSLLINVCVAHSVLLCEQWNTL